MTETEIRFALTPDLAQQVHRHYFADDAQPEENTTVYYDTPDHLLWRHRTEFRVRRNAGGVRQTVKHQPAGRALFTREEAEIALAGDAPDMDHLMRSIPPDLAAKVETASLAPVFRTAITRRKTVFRHNACAVELACDQGSITAGRRTLPVHEVELELKEGTPAALAEAALDFLALAPTGLLMQGKAERGYLLADGGEPRPVYQDKQEIAPDALLPDAFASMLRAGLAQALANQAALIATEEPEAVHQMRVGLRRVRSIVSAFRPALDLHTAEPLLAGTKAFFTELGDLREADVFLTETIGIFPADALGEDRRSLLLREAGRFRAQARKRCVAFAAGPGFARLMLGWLRWLEAGGWLRHDQPLDRLLATRPAGQFAQSRLDSLNRKLLKRGQRALKGGIDDWHETRIAAKKLRYAGGPLLAVAGGGEDLARTAKGTPRTVKRLARLQNELGAFNDLCNVGPFLDRVAATTPARARPAFDAAAAYCKGWCDAQVQHTIPRLAASWRAFEEAVEATP